MARDVGMDDGLIRQLAEQASLMSEEARERFLGTLAPEVRKIIRIALATTHIKSVRAGMGVG